jgi:diguanylate cyclase (GGDEF)-like protein/PAS domain S-box-containing protein
MDVPGTLERQTTDYVGLAAEQIDHAILVASPSGEVVYSNRAFHDMFGYHRGDMEGHNATELLAAEGFDAGTMERVRKEIGQGRTFEEEVPVLGKDGEVFWMSAVVKPLFDGAGALAHYLLVFSDINDSKQIQRLQRDVLEAIAQDRPIREVMDLICRRVELIAPDVVCSILSVDEDQCLHPLAAPALPAHFGATIDGLKIGPKHGSCGTAAWRNEPVIVEDIETDPLWEDFKALPLPLGLLACWSSPITLRDGRVGGTFAFYYRQKRGPSVWHEHIVRACVNLCVVALERDEATARIGRLAYYDGLTGLPNRTRLREQMEATFDRAEMPGQAALLFIDIDHFKDVNDTLGHSVGDSFLKEIGSRIVAEVWDVDIVCRHGGDEFVVVLNGADGPRAQRVAEALLGRLAQPVRVEGVTLPASVSIGISLCPDNGTDSATLLRNADTAMYRAKSEGRSTFRFFAAEMNRMAQDRLLLGALLRDAVTEGQVRVAYQPQIDASSGAVAGAEALARWTHPALGPVPPSRFIPLAEEFGLIEAIGEACLNESCAQLRRWDRAGYDVPLVAVNISAIQFRNPEFPSMVAKMLMAHGLTADRLTIEVTESVMMDAYPVAFDNAHSLREMGVTISMDDFGTGYSSLSNLAKLPVSELKIDRSFMADLEENETVQAMVTAVIRIGETLKLRVVAEGVESVAQRRFLEALGCDVLQGYLFGEAMPPHLFEAWLERHSSSLAPAVRLQAS